MVVVLMIAKIIPKQPIKVPLKNPLISIGLVFSEIRIIEPISGPRKRQIMSACETMVYIRAMKARSIFYKFPIMTVIM